MSDISFTDGPDIDVLINGRVAGWFPSEKDCGVVFTFYAHAEEYTSEELRAIADKLDKLNLPGNQAMKSIQNLERNTP